MSRNAIIVFLIVATVFGNSMEFAAKTRIRRIVNGYKANIKYHNYYVYLVLGNSFCGGTLIKQDLVLTAAHCLINVHASQIRVLVEFSSRRDRTAQSYNAAWYRIHPQYKRVPFYDVGVVKLTSKASKNNVIQIAETSPGIGYWVRIVGYGTIACKPIYNSRGQITCSSVYDEYFKTTVTQIQSYDRHVMITYNRGTSACYGDSGSSVVDQNQLVGVVSAVDTFCNGRNSLVSVSKNSEIYVSFIKHYM